MFAGEFERNGKRYDLHLEYIHFGDCYVNKKRLSRGILRKDVCFPADGQYTETITHAQVMDEQQARAIIDCFDKWGNNCIEGTIERLTEEIEQKQQIVKYLSQLYELETEDDKYSEISGKMED
jgi:hypothetical protein